MSDCRRTAERLASYVDNTLTPAERREIEQHLNACPPCRVAADSERGGWSILRECAPRLRAEPLPPGLRSRCEALARTHGTGGRRFSLAGPALVSRATFWRSRVVPVVLIAILIVFTSSALFSLATRRSDAVLAAQLTADHVKCFRVFAPDDAPAADARMVEASLATRYGWNVRVPGSSPANGLKLVGARRCLYADGSVPHVMYRLNGKDVSLFMLEGVARNPADLVTLGHRSRIWTRGHTTYVLVSPASAGELAAVTRYVMQEAH